MEYNAKQDLYDFVEKFKYDFNIKIYPFDTVSFCNNSKNIELIYRKFNTPGLCGVSFLGKKTNTVILNANRNSLELNFDCGHEMIHIFRHKNKNDGYFACTEKFQNSFLEWEANEGAAELLLPYRQLLTLIKDNWNSLCDCWSVEKFKTYISQRFNVPYTVVTNRIENLKYETMQYICGTPLNNIELLSNNQQNKRGIIVSSLNDIAKESEELFYETY